MDRIAVVDGGHIAEFDTPANLLSNSNSLFSNLYHRDCWVAINHRFDCKIEKKNKNRILGIINKKNCREKFIETEIL